MNMNLWLIKSSPNKMIKKVHELKRQRFADGLKISDSSFIFKSLLKFLKQMKS